MKYNIQVKIFTTNEKNPSSNFSRNYTINGTITGRSIKDTIRETLSMKKDIPYKEVLYIGNKEAKDTDVIGYESSLEYDITMGINNNVSSPDVKGSKVSSGFKHVNKK